MMTDNERLLIRAIMAIFCAVAVYRIESVDKRMDHLEDKIDKIITNKQDH